MNEMQIFNNPEFGEVRTIQIDGAPWFVGKDVAAALEYENTRDAISRHVDEEDKNTVAFHDGIRGNPNMTVINESGVYALIFGSKLERAKRFKHWVTSEVLPAIRKTGQYLIPGMAPQLCPVKPSSAGEVAQLLRVLRATMKDNYQTPDVIAKTAENICKQFGIILPDDFARTTLPVYHEVPFVDWVPGEDGEK